MASSYGGSASQVNSGLLLKKSSSDLNLPVFYYCLKAENGSEQQQQQFELDLWREEDFDQLYKMFEQIVDEGQTYPQSSINETEFRNYFLGGDAFVVRTRNVGDQSTKVKVAGAFYIKPNFPGRSSHLANYGLMVNRDYRGKGIATFMVEQCIRLAPLVGPFRALYTNLVYVTNVASIRACERFGFTQVGRVPNAGNLKGIGYTDALQFYREV